jgi:Fe2+ or Zn2+ uptake regulation protein
MKNLLLEEYSHRCESLKSFLLLEIKDMVKAPWKKHIFQLSLHSMIFYWKCAICKKKKKRFEWYVIIDF